MNPIEQAYREARQDAQALIKTGRNWEHSQAKQAAARYDALLTTWRLRAEYCRAKASHAWANGMDGEAIRCNEEAEIYERIVAEAARLEEQRHAD